MNVFDLSDVLSNFNVQFTQPPKILCINKYIFFPYKLTWLIVFQADNTKLDSLIWIYKHLCCINMKNVNLLKCVFIREILSFLDFLLFVVLFSIGLHLIDGSNSKDSI